MVLTRRIVHVHAYSVSREIKACFGGTEYKRMSYSRYSARVAFERPNNDIERLK
jgi:hypothetical protein